MSSHPALPRLITGHPVKAIRKTARGNRGQVHVLGKYIGYQSTLERDLLIVLDVDPTAVEVVGQPVTFEYRHPGTGLMTPYTPDIYVRHVGTGAREVLYQVKYRADLCEAYRANKGGWLAAKRIAAEHGMTHRIITDKEIRGPLLDNAWILKRFARFKPDQAVEDRLLSVLAGLADACPRTLLVAAFDGEDDRANALPRIWRLIAHGVIGADLRAAALTMSSPIAIADKEEQGWFDPYTPARRRASSS